jgi:thiamine-monophosphate kinase
MGEFELIECYFRAAAQGLVSQRGDVILGIGDDAALLDMPADRQLVAALDTLVEGRHFPADCAPASIGHRALAVNLSDLAAMGADPAWCLLALTLPRAEPSFLQPFSDGLLALARRYGVALVGGDTTGGPLSVSVQALGFVPPGTALRRDAGRAGDLLYVSGTPGDAAAGLALLQAAAAAGPADAQQQYLLQRFLYPEPRIELGRALRGLASACIDVSDGLVADAGKLAVASGCGAAIDAAQLPLSDALIHAVGTEQALLHALTGGDDYELCFTAPAARRAELEARLTNVKCRVTCIGLLEKQSGLRVTRNGAAIHCDTRGYDHFRTG